MKSSWQQVAEFCLCARGKTVVAALSGGADSVAMTHFLWTQKDKIGFALRACHINHNLRGEESLRDEAFVRDFCLEREIPLQVFSVEIENSAKQAGMSTESYGRKVRYERLKECAQDGLIATAHTLDDRIETSCINFLRGTGLRGLVSIPRVNEQIIRPLLTLSRAEIEQYCEAHNLSYVTDSTNRQEQFLRNRVRAKVVPVLRDISPQFEKTYERTLAHLQQDEEYLTSQADAVFLEALGPDGLDVEMLTCQHGAVMFRVLRRFLWSQGLSYEQAHIENMQQMIKNKSGACQLSKEMFAVVRGGKLVLEKKTPPFVFAPMALVPGEIPKNPLARGQLALLNCEQFTNLLKQDRNILKNTLDYGKICGRLFLKQKTSGDYLRLAHRHVGKSLKKWFYEAGIAPENRNRIPVVCDERGVVWVSRLGIDARVKPDEQTTQFLHFAVEEEAADER